MKDFKWFKLVEPKEVEPTPKEVDLVERFLAAWCDPDDLEGGARRSAEPVE